MPTYQYACTECGEQLEVVQKFTDDALTTCPACEGKLRKVFSAVGVVFKGSGFYRTDSRAGANGSSDSSDSSSNGSDSSASGGSTTEKSGAKSASSSSSDGSSSSSGSPSSSSSSNGSKAASSKASTPAA